jgi:hypothetical protein
MVTHIEGGTMVGVFKNRVLRKILQPKRKKVTGESRRLHTEEHNDLD